MLRLHNTLSRNKEEFQPLDPARGVRIYSCGPTVYNYAHIGNFRSFLFADLLRRYLKFRGYTVTQVMNLTDVDDKTIRESRVRDLSLNDFTSQYIEAFFQDLDALNIERVEQYPRATGHIPEMIELITKLIDKGVTYRHDGSLYFRISDFHSYGNLSGIDLERVRSGLRYDSDEYEKDDIRDFVLWKAAKDDEPSWESPFGRGRPGWHIECSAMSMKYLGEGFDIHTGGVDNIFPHHENEIAQSETVTGKPFVRFWMHAAYLQVEADKMSKSKGNIVTVRELRERGEDLRAVRYFLLSSHYRKPINFSTETFQHAQAAVQRMQEFVDRVLVSQPESPDGVLEGIIAGCRDRFVAGLDDDLNMANALAAVFELIRDANTAMTTGGYGLQDRQQLLDQFKDWDRVLGVLTFHRQDLAGEAETLIKAREKARRKRDWSEADRIRDRLGEMGIVLEDTRDGTRWRRK